MGEGFYTTAQVVTLYGVPTLCERSLLGGW